MCVRFCVQTMKAWNISSSDWSTIRTKPLMMMETPRNKQNQTHNHNEKQHSRNIFTNISFFFSSSRASEPRFLPLFPLPLIATINKWKQKETKKTTTTKFTLGFCGSFVGDISPNGAETSRNSQKKIAFFTDLDLHKTFCFLSIHCIFQSDFFPFPTPWYQ